MSRRWTRRDRRRLAAHTASAVAVVQAGVEATAKRTQAELAGPMPEQGAHWMKHSYGSWRRGA